MFPVLGNAVTASDLSPAALGDRVPSTVAPDEMRGALVGEGRQPLCDGLGAVWAPYSLSRISTAMSTGHFVPSDSHRSDRNGRKEGRTGFEPAILGLKAQCLSS